MMSRVQFEVSKNDSDTHALGSAMMRSQHESTERLLASHTSSTATFVAGLMERIEANMTTRDTRIELLASSHKAQAEAAAASAAAQETFMRQMQLIVNQMPTIQVASGSGGDDPPRYPQGSRPSIEGHGNGKFTLSVSSAMPVRASIPLSRGDDNGERRWGW